MGDKGPVVCLGIMVADLIGGPIQELPKAGSLVLVEEMGLYQGGCAVNTAVALSILGLQAEVIGKVGCDPLGDFLIEALTRRGVGIRGVRREDQVDTSATMVMFDPDGERRFVHYIGANALLQARDVDLDLIRQAKILHIGGSLVMPGIDGQPAAEILREAKAAGTVTFLDTAWDATGRWMEVLGPCLPYVDYFVPSLAEARALSGLTAPEHVARFLLDEGVGTLALKMGASGCLVMADDRQALRLPAFAVNAVDATGAGDAFAAGFVAGVWHGWPLKECARLANAVGALCVTGIGAEGGVRSLEETLEFMTRTPLRSLPSREA